MKTCITFLSHIFFLSSIFQNDYANYRLKEKHQSFYLTSHLILIKTVSLFQKYAYIPV